MCFLYAGGLYIQVVFRAGLTVYFGTRSNSSMGVQHKDGYYYIYQGVFNQQIYK